MRRRPLPLENWPAPQFDDETVESAIQAMDVQAAAGFNFLDAWGLFATYGWPPDIASAVDDQRRRRLHRLQDAARQRNIRLVLGLGTYSWGYDKIIEADPAVRGRNPDGTPHAHALCDANPKSFEYVKRIIDFTLGQFDFGAVHLESCDLGCCWCPQCAGKDRRGRVQRADQPQDGRLHQTEMAGQDRLRDHDQLGPSGQAIWRRGDGQGR